jgi:hypothetical protein
MLSEHNPIAELVHQIQQKWIEDAAPFPKLKLVRWLIKPEEARLYEGFLKLESTEHGAIPEMLVAMLTPFTTVANYSREIIEDWAAAYKKDTKTQEKLHAKNVSFAWDAESYLSTSKNTNNNCSELLVQMISDFQQALPDKNMRLVVALFPHAVHDFDGFRYWLADILKKELPQEISFMIFDHIGENYYDKVFEKYPGISKTLHVNLNMDDAISKIAKMGDPNSPEVKFRECILEMGKAVQKNDLPRVDAWGEKALLATQQSGLKSMFASAHLVYAGMLFTFKKFDKIDSLLVKGLHLAEQGLKLNDPSCKPLVIQFYGYMAASKQLQKNIPEAIKFYEQQGDTAVSYQLAVMSLTPYQQAYTLSGKKVSHLYDDLLKKAFNTGISLQKEELANSSFNTIAFDYFTWQQDHQQHTEAAITDKKLKEIFGEDWKEKAKQTGTQYEINTRPQASVN